MRSLHAKLRVVVALSAALALLLVAAGGTGAAAQTRDRGRPAVAACGHGQRVPPGRISIQLWTFASYLGFGGDAATQARLEEVLAGLAEIGYRNVEPYSLHGLSAEEFSDLAAEYGLRVPSRHGSTNEATWDQTLADAHELRQRYTGSGGFASPGIGSYEDVLATAATLDRLGERSVRNGTGKIFGHNHQGEFRTTYTDPATGETKSAWELLVEHTNPRYVAFQLDIPWAMDGGADVLSLLEEHGDRIELLHVKDAVGIADPANATPVPVGEGEVDFEPILDAAQGHVRYYVIEQDPPFGDPTYDPFASAETSFDALTCMRF